MNEFSPSPERPDEPKPIRLIVLAGQRPNGPDPLAERFGENHKCLIPLAGRPLIAHVLQTGAHHPRVASLVVCVEPEAFAPIYDVLTRQPGRGTVALVEARDDLADSVRAAAEGWNGPSIVTTADHALLTAASIDAMADALEEADVAFGLARREAVEAAHPSGQRRYLALRDGEFAICNLYGFSGPSTLRAVGVFRGQRFNRSGRRIVRAAGLVGLAMTLFRLETLASAIERASRHLALAIRPVILCDGSQAIDVDDDRTYAVVRDLLERRPKAEEASSRAVA